MLIPPQRLAVASYVTFLHVSEVARRYRRLGFSTPDPSSLRDGGMDQEDLQLLDLLSAGVSDFVPFTPRRSPSRRRRRSGRFDHLLEAPSTELPMAAILAAAGRFRCDIEEVTRRLSSLGLDVPEIQALRRQPDALDVILLSQSLNGERPWLHEGVVPLSHVIAAAGRLGEPPSRIVERLTALGFTAAG